MIAEVACDRGVLAVRLAAVARSLSSAVLGGGLGLVRTWLNVQVPPDYARLDPAHHLAEVAVARGERGPLVGMLTAADVAGYLARRVDGALAIGTVGLGQPLAAASTRPRPAPRIAARPGTINLFVITAAPLSPAGLVNAVQTAAEAKAQALAEAAVPALNADGPATGTATDSICVACPVASSASGFAGPATEVGAALARAVRAVVLDGATVALPAARSQA